MIIMEELGQQFTVGSYSVRDWYTELRRIVAAAREMLIAAAAEGWRVPVSECTAANSIVTHGPSGRTKNYGTLATLAASLPIPQQTCAQEKCRFQGDWYITCSRRCSTQS